MTNKTIQPPPATTVPIPHYSRPKFGHLLRTTDRNNNQSSPLSDDAGSSSSYNIKSGTSTPPSSPTTNSPRRFSLSDELGDSESNQNSPYIMSPWNEPSSPYIQSPWKKLSPSPPQQYHRQSDDSTYIMSSRYRSGLLGSLLREEGHISSLAASGGVLYTGSGSKNIRVWKEFRDAGGFKSNSGLVKAIIICPEPAADSKKKVVFTGHQDGKIRVWKSAVSANTTRRIGSLPTLRDYLKTSINPKKYVSVRRNRNVPCVRHFDAVSCLCLNVESGLLYSGSWDKTIKVWRLSDSKCLESFTAHEDAINSIAVSSFDGIVFSGSADGTVRVWRQELRGKRTSHFYVQTLLSQESAITSLALSWKDSQTVYCGSSDGLVNFWERDKGWLSYGGVLRGHKMAVLCMVTAGGCLLFSGSADKSICVWKREDGGVHSCLSVLTGHCGPVKCLAVEEDRAGEEEEEELDGDDGRSSWIVYSGSLDKSVKVWRVYENEEELPKSTYGR